MSSSPASSTRATCSAVRGSSSPSTTRVASSTHASGPPTRTRTCAPLPCLRRCRRRPTRPGRRRRCCASSGTATGGATGPTAANVSGNRARRTTQQCADEPWAQALTEEVLQAIPHSSDYRSREELAAARTALSPLHIDQRSGLRRVTLTVLREGFAGVLPRSLYHQARRVIADRSRSRGSGRLGEQPRRDRPRPARRSRPSGSCLAASAAPGRAFRTEASPSPKPPLPQTGSRSPAGWRAW